MFGQFQITSLAVIPVLGVLIFLHELGHFLAAKWMGVRVLEFGFGYPPRMVKLFERGGVEYTLNWLPFGGFVRMAGEEGDYDAPDSLPNVAPWRRIIVMVAGPFMNFMTAIVIYTFLMVVGIPQFTGDITTVPVQIVAVSPDTPAAAAGLAAGDIIVAINGKEVKGIEEVSKIIKENAGKQLELTVQRGDEKITTSLRPRLPEEVPPGQGATGIQITSYIPPEDLTVVRYGPVQALVGGLQQTTQLLGMMIQGLGDMLRALISPNASPPEGSVGGLVAIGRITAEVARQGWRDLLTLTAFLSINLGLLNLLPIPALDGGRIVFAFVEMLRRKRIPPEREALVHLAGFALLLAFMVIVTFMDVSNWVAGKPAIPGG
ncbi:MAG: RIP metalloprotease RseP [Chloroflexi bacterium]|nr:RIP metalloprotease RseP [Chloroflexota bacterium]